MSTLAGAVINIILDPIFIFGLHWGMMGAAVATVIGQVATAILSFWYLLHMRIIRPEADDYRIAGGLCTRMLTLGMTSFLSQISLVAAMAEALAVHVAEIASSVLSKSEAMGHKEFYIPYKYQDKNIPPKACEQ